MPSDAESGGTQTTGIVFHRFSSHNSAKSVRIAAGGRLHFSIRLCAMASDKRKVRSVDPYRISWARLGRIGELQ